jgi:hypothetical protein
MNMKRNILGIAIAFLLIAQTSIAGAQTIQNAKSRRGSWSELAKNRSHVQNTTPTDIDQNLTAKEGAIEAQATSDAAKIVGTWYITVPDAPGAPGFKALHTFNDNGTFTETSDLLGTLVEGPSHGAWTGKKNDYRLTFQLFGFDENGLPTVRIRVRCTIRIVNDNTLTATATVDIIEPDGNIIPAVGTGTFSGTRVTVVPE